MKLKLKQYSHKVKTPFTRGFYFCYELATATIVATAVVTAVIAAPTAAAEEDED